MSMTISVQYNNPWRLSRNTRNLLWWICGRGRFWAWRERV